VWGLKRRREGLGKGLIPVGLIRKVPREGATVESPKSETVEKEEGWGKKANITREVWHQRRA